MSCREHIILLYVTDLGHCSSMRLSRRYTGFGRRDALFKVVKIRLRYRSTGFLTLCSKRLGYR